MKALRVLLALVAFFIALVGAGEATTQLHLSISLVAFALAVSNLFGIVGISPIKFSVFASRVMSALSMVALAGLGSFGKYMLAHPEFAQHTVLVRLIHAAGVLGTLCGIAGSSNPFGGTVLPPPATPPAVEPPAAA